MDVRHIKTAETGSPAIKRDRRGRILKGSSALNPLGRPPSKLTVFMERVRTAAIETALPALIQGAENGDMEAAKTLLMAGLPKLKPVTPLEDVPLPAKEDTDAAGKVEAVLSLIEKGAMTMEQAVLLLDGIKTLVDCQLQTQLEERISALESGAKKNAGQQAGVLIVPGLLSEQAWNEATDEVSKTI